MYTHLNEFAQPSQLRTFSKPDYLKLYQPSTKPEKNKMVLSKHNVWITVEEKKNFSRKNAPEVAKVPQTETEKMS
jgi:hypothetical protein